MAYGNIDVVGAPQEVLCQWERHLAEDRDEAPTTDDGEVYGVIARLHLRIPIGANSFRMMTLESGGLWGVEVSGEDDPYLDEVYQEQRADLMATLRTLAEGILAGKIPE